MTTKKASPADPVRFAVIGQGHFAQSAILPAFANARACQLTALFSDDATKLRALKKKYGVEYALPYDQFVRVPGDAARSTPSTSPCPNDLHAAFTESAAGAGVHVLCEKPIAASSAQAERMIAACERGGVKLMIAYRLHFEEANLSAMEIVQQRQDRRAPVLLGDVLAAGDARQHAHQGRSRRRPLRDIGIYCINAARYLFRDEPTEAVALAATKAGDARFREIDEQVSALLRFPGDRLAQLTCSFGAYNQSSVHRGRDRRGSCGSVRRSTCRTSCWRWRSTGEEQAAEVQEARSGRARAGRAWRPASGRTAIPSRQAARGWLTCG